MSRSYKKHPYGGDDKSNKRIANKKVRNFLKNQYDELIQKADYKKCFEQYDICDYWSRCTFEEYCEFREKFFDEDVSDKKKMRREWSKWYRRK